MKHYKDYGKYTIGESDIARLVLSAPEGVFPLEFGSDGSYGAYICDDELDLNSFSHYEKVFECTFWLTIYDDDSYSCKLEAEKISVYRAGEFGVLIHLQNE